jgi:very-short-patch-repair endonuclease
VEEFGHEYRAQSPARLATAQDGVIARWQLVAMGWGRGKIAGRVASRYLLPHGRGVYTVGHARLTIRGRYLAAVLACGPDAVLSHHAAAAVWDLRPHPQGAIDVSVPIRRVHDGVRFHVVAPLAPADRTTLDGIPVTALASTLLDYAEIARARQLAAALEAAQQREILDFRTIESMIARHPGRRGLKPLAAALAQLRDDLPWTHSQTEHRFLELIAAAGLPAPRTNVLIDGDTVDCMWPAQRLVIEVDAFRTHGSRPRFETNRRRDIRLQIAGWRVVRVAGERVWEAPGALMADIAALLDAPPPAR